MARKKILVTGGTVFVSRYVAEYYVKQGFEVYVLNRNTKPQSDGVILIDADRRNIGDALRHHHFDTILDVTAYNDTDINCLIDGVGGFGDYIMISSSAVYPETSTMPVTEDSPVGANIHWGKYGTDKIAAENALLKRVPNAYILRPPYLYGSMNNLYREAFVFECALQGRPFYLPKEGKMNLHFFHVYDLCRFIDVILEKKPDRHIFNVGNSELITVLEWVELCYAVSGCSAEFINVSDNFEQMNYFSFRDYEYSLDIRYQHELMPDTMSMADGLADSLEWYLSNRDKVRTKPYFDFIKNFFEK